MVPLKFAQITPKCGVNMTILRTKNQPRIDYEQAYELGKIQCTQEECAAVFGVGMSTLDRDLEFKRRHREGKLAGYSALRKRQFKKAMQGNVTMLTWLGKNYLGQTDSRKVEHTGQIDIAAMSREELERLVQGETIEAEIITEHSTQAIPFLNEHSSPAILEGETTIPQSTGETTNFKNETGTPKTSVPEPKIDPHQPDSDSIQAKVLRPNPNTPPNPGFPLSSSERVTGSQSDSVSDLSNGTPGLGETSEVVSEKPLEGLSAEKVDSDP